QVTLIEATRDATLGDCARATQLAKQALDLSREQANLFNAANAYAACGQTAPAQSLIDELTRGFPDDTLLNANWLPIIRAQFGLARAATLTGDIATARTAYLDFFALWKDADSNLPALVAARAEYDKLK